MTGPRPNVRMVPQVTWHPVNAPAAHGSGQMNPLPIIIIIAVIGIIAAVAYFFFK
jgi:hypothetical protein